MIDWVSKFVSPMYCLRFNFLTFYYYSIEEIDDKPDAAVLLLFAAALDLEADSNIVLVVTLDLDLLPLRSFGD